MLRIVQNIHVETACDGLSQVHCLSRPALRIYPNLGECAQNTDCACGTYFYKSHVLANERVDLIEPGE